ncbi:hypothetical protein [Methylocella sp.]|uniref:hypothetical protein n=1 Tax=Methylocella sp. TaxID=1978226 RepID=UPI0037842084
MKMIGIVASAAVALTLAAGPADAWMRSGGGGFGGGGFHGGGFGGGDWSRGADGGVAHTSDSGGFEHGTAIGPSDVAHASDAGGAWHGSAADGDAACHGGTYGGYYHGTVANGSGAYHTGAYGDYYHQPVVANSYGGGCYNCGSGGWGAAGSAAGAIAVGAAATGAAIAVAASRPAVGATYGYLPSACAYAPAGGEPYYSCGGYWVKPAYGANGVYYRVVGSP